MDMGTWYWYHTARTKEQQTTKEPGKDRETKRKKEKVKKEEVNFFHFFFILFKKCYDKCLNALRVLSRECALYSTVFVVAGVVLALYTILYSYRVYVQFICYYINMHSAIIQYHAIIIIYISYRIMYYNICDHVRYGTMQYDDDDKLYFVFCILSEFNFNFNIQ